MACSKSFNWLTRLGVNELNELSREVAGPSQASARESTAACTALLQSTTQNYQNLSPSIYYSCLIHPERKIGTGR